MPKYKLCGCRKLPKQFEEIIREKYDGKASINYFEVMFKHEVMFNCRFTSKCISFNINVLI